MWNVQQIVKTLTVSVFFAVKNQNSEPNFQNLFSSYLNHSERENHRRIHCEENVICVWSPMCVRVYVIFPSYFFRIVYKTPGIQTGRGQNIFNCKYNSPPPPGKVCDVNIKDFKKCTQENNYSYHKSSPCVFIKMNRIYGWVPEYYNRTDNLPDKMPKQLKQRIVNETDATEVRDKRFDLWLCSFERYWNFVIFLSLNLFKINTVKYRMVIVRRWKSSRHGKYRAYRILSASRFSRLLFSIRKFWRLFKSISCHSFHQTNA